VPAEFLPI